MALVKVEFEVGNYVSVINTDKAGYDDCGYIIARYIINNTPQYVVFLSEKNDIGIYNSSDLAIANDDNVTNNIILF